MSIFKKDQYKIGDLISGNIGYAIEDDNYYDTKSPETRAIFLRTKSRSKGEGLQLYENLQSSKFFVLGDSYRDYVNNGGSYDCPSHTPIIVNPDDLSEFYNREELSSGKISRERVQEIYLAMNNTIANEASISKSSS